MPSPGRIEMAPVVGHWVRLTKSGRCWVGKCPFHDDTLPSLVVYKDHAHCFGCNWHGDAISFIEDILPTNFAGAVKWLQDHNHHLILHHTESYGTAISLTPIPQMILGYWQLLMTNDVLEYYHWRGLSSDTIEFFGLGWSGDAYIIPIWEGRPQESLVYGVKFRRANDNSPKYWGLARRNQPRLFNQWVLEGAERAFIFFGEFDAILAHQDGMTAVSPTSGKGVWLSKWNHQFGDVSKVYVIPDVGEETAGYRVASNFLGRSKVCFFPRADKDYTEYRQAGKSVEEFRQEVLCFTN